MQQRSADWYAIRCGRATASRIADIVARTKSGPSASRANYAAQLVAERLTGYIEPGFTSPAMQWGVDTEAEARMAYGMYAGALVDEVGFVEHPRVAMSGASPDGLVGADGLVEIKCPNTATHIETLRGAPVAAKYRDQMQWQLACTGRAWCDFASYDPRLPETLRLHVTRIDRDDARIAELEREVAAFLAEVAETVAELETIASQGRAAGEPSPEAAR